VLVSHGPDGGWVQHAMDQIKPREDSIGLMHDIHKTTVDHVESLIDRIKRIPGHRFTCTDPRDA
jgi:hypothetical protein